MEYAFVQAGLVVEMFEEFVEIEFPSSNGGTAPEIRKVSISERFHPDFVATLVPVPEGLTVEPGDSYDGATFGPPVVIPAPPPTAAQVVAERSARMAQATAEIAPLQDLVDLDEIDEDDEAKLLEWKQYRAAVSKVQTQPGYPSAVVWPDVPTI